MKSKNLFPTLLSPIFPLLNLCIFLILSSPLPTKSQGVVDPYFQVCSAEPGNCGDGQPINYPFHIRSKQNRSCGYPGFELSCNNNGQPTINIQSNDYIIHNISYETQILRVSSADFWNSTTGCIPLTQAISFPSARFELAPFQTHDVNLLYGCDASTLESALRFSYPGCDHGENKNGSVLVLPENDPKLRNVSKACTTRVVAPVEPYERENRDGIERALRNGFWVKWKASDCSICQESGGRCGFNYTEWHFKCFCPDRPHAWHCVSEKKRKWVIPLIAVGCSVLLISICLGVTIWSCYKKKHASSNLLARAITYSRSDLEGGSVYFGVPLFSYSELQEATNNFDIEKELGDGGFGTVYYGKLRDGREVAVKRLYEHNYKRVEQFMNEVEILTRLRHTNLVSLYGCTSRHSRELLLVYEYIPNGTVADHIHGDRATPGSLTWPTRMSIAIETANALAYLHASDIIHRDVKTNNILLDNNFSVKVADFGLSRLFPTDVTHVSTAPQGTPGYVDPEYHQCYQLTSKSDVYSFGVVLIELISSLTAVDIGRHRHEINLANLAINKIEKCAFHELIDPHLGFHSDDEVKRMTISVASLAFQCVQQDKELRPSMDEVLKELHNIRNCKDVPKDQEKAYEDAGMLNIDTQTSPDCDEVGLLKTKQLPPSPNCLTDNWTSRSTTPISSN
ncbi:LEAF RUST 10 DISEASE-RESISTANCE LOCUS RECEPTOR-LIKE PROTEIN KINASE-like 1.2 isoform X1 [Juglans microcarpa x Juglans regia]|uniref:LEAF RUST 10 DISEASE-RESISTANCE LOCUS RECEPTOR-LIKE PROTEIN KINASE-like 1.2 isoform X1 n=1 Tax=Juglans microcarpa x Juglans regia TaxID=2249226 RepID=UPI001B7F64A6|nr:LEAF RUST 10 DISEASE-RESISTANCE LOCUS RECEPTOR-LIKE PROTEIN KINASE-like 1.2 isoform X1 [Juglans microcarpa x Juglans regia]